jgi:deoxyribodipyrimidine photolyase-related protein
MNVFKRQLDALTPKGSERNRNWLFVPYDQLTCEFGPLAREAPGTLGIILVESPEKASRRPYHKQKLALVLTNLRHFALEQAARGVRVKHLVGPYADALSALGQTGIRVMEPAEWELREELKPLVASGVLTVIPHEGWLTSPSDFEKSQSTKTFRMDAFYKSVRVRSGLLMSNGKPEGGKFSFDAENRQKWTGSPAAPDPLTFQVDAVTQEVCALVEQTYAHHPGSLHPEALPASQADAEALWQHAKKSCLPFFGPYEDAMSTASRTLFHSCISPVLNLGRLAPARLVQEVAAMRAPLASREGFIRQILGWREFVHHVHVATDGFRTLEVRQEPKRSSHGDGGFADWSKTVWPAQKGTPASTVSFLGAQTPIPPAFWGAKSGLFCLDHVVESVWQDAYSHHITRLMVLSNIATLLDISPRDLTDWFWVAYQDAYDWVVEPNVLGMGTFAAGDLMTTKPYISGAAYIHKMSDYCGKCEFDPKKTCPLTRLYWAFLDRHQDALKGNHRLSVPLGASRKRAEAEKQKDRDTFQYVQTTLAKGKRLKVLPE